MIHPSHGRWAIRFNVSQLLKEPPGSARTCEVSASLSSLEVTIENEAHGTVNLVRTDKGIWVTAKLDSQALCSCSRCLSSFPQPLRIVIEEEFFPTVDVVSGVALDTSGLDAEGFAIDEYHLLDLTEALRQYTIVAVPMKPLCKADCAGICPTCGTNLNESTCDCDKSLKDGRWGPLLERLSAERRS